MLLQYTTDEHGEAVRTDAADAQYFHYMDTQVAVMRVEQQQYFTIV